MQERNSINQLRKYNDNMTITKCLKHKNNSKCNHRSFRIFGMIMILIRFQPHRSQIRRFRYGNNFIRWDSFLKRPNNNNTYTDAFGVVLRVDAHVFVFVVRIQMHPSSQCTSANELGITEKKNQNKAYDSLVICSAK